MDYIRYEIIFVLLRRFTTRWLRQRLAVSTDDLLENCYGDLLRNLYALYSHTVGFFLEVLSYPDAVDVIKGVTRLGRR
jgi:hypothetical protein